MGKHRKHAKLKLRDYETYAPNEIAFLGTNCGTIEALVNDVSALLSSYRIAYFDASHSKELEVPALETFTFHNKGTLSANLKDERNKFNQRIQFSPYDLVCVNGNHFPAAKQILILDETKEQSVIKRLPEINAIAFIIKLTPETQVFDALKEAYKGIENITCYTIDELPEIAAHIERIICQKIAPINGLVLAGGKSMRMGKDKGKLDFYGKEQREVAIELLEKNNLKTFLSVRQEQEISKENCITDAFLGLGPFGAICSAFQKNPDVAWLVLATDLPFVSDEIIQLLLKNRNPSKFATTIKGKSKEFPEPLITIWEPKSYPVLLNYLAQGYSCPRKILINTNVEIVEVDDSFIRNINTPQEFKDAYDEINS